MTSATLPPVQAGASGRLGVPRQKLAGLDGADQCRLLGVQVGQTIEGLEGRQEADSHWSLARLTLLWLGESVAVWRVTERSSDRPEWSKPRESAAWTLECREWHVVPAEGRGP